MANLQQVGIQQMESLKALYTQDFPKYCKEYLCLENFLELHRKDTCLKNVKVYCLPNLDLGLFVILDRYQIFLGCKESDRSENLLCESLNQLNWFGGQQLSSMPQRYVKAATKVIEAKQLHIEHNHTTGLQFLAKESAQQWQVEPPAGYEIKSLTLKDAKTLNDHWKYKEPGSLLFMQRQISFNTSDGLLAVLQVKESHKRRGFGALIVKEFSRRVALQGQDVIAEVDKENTASASLFKKLGFKVIDQCHWLVTRAPNGDLQWPDGE
ncbi:hypothetical protein KR074_006737 [Drosophila pseudoananassae]|nr:hypothetical protein KR074_006737 [Drosophila pseudoananassae]